MRVIPLTKGFCAIISKQDYRRVNRHSWHVHFSAGTKRRPGQPYARANINGKKVYLHRFVMDKQLEICMAEGCSANEKNWQVDHKNYQTLDCRQDNLEVVFREENLKRRRIKKCG